MKYSILLAFFVLGCAPRPQVTEDKTSVAPVTAAESGTEPMGGATSQGTAIDARVAAARARLETSSAGQLVWRAIEAHGGLENWLNARTMSFRFNYAPVDPAKKPNDTRQIIDLLGSRAHHTLAADPGIQFGWDGNRAWVHPPEAETGTNPRFWALTPYYFVGVPFVLGDEGVKLVLENDVEFEGQVYQTVRVTFAAGTGDAPEDYYVVYVNKGSGKIGGLRYVVSYKGFFPNGGHSPEKFMAYDGAQEVSGMILPVAFRTFGWDGSKTTELVTRTTLSEVAFGQEFPAVPEGAQVLDGY